MVGVYEAQEVPQTEDIIDPKIQDAPSKSNGRPRRL